MVQNQILQSCKRGLRDSKSCIELNQPHHAGWGRVGNQKRLDLMHQFLGDVGDRSGVFTFTSNLQTSEWAESVNIQMLECHVDHGVEDVVVLSNAVGMKAFSQTVISVLGDVPMSEFIQVHVAKLRHKAFEVLIGIEFEFASVG